MKKPAKKRIAFQGMLGAFSHQAGRLFLESSRLNPDSCEYVPCRSFDDLFQEVIQGRSDIGIVPLENSSIGSIVTNYDLLWAHAIQIVGEVCLPIHHNLLALDGTRLDEIREVYSHPAALEQCRLFLSQMPSATSIAFFDTSGAAAFVSEQRDKHKAAIAGEFAAQLHGLKVLRSNIEDHPHNRTRFGVITGQKDERHPNIPAPPYKISCAVELEHAPGSLCKLLSRIASLDINLTKLESRPMPQAPWHYRFFIDMELDGRDQDPGLETVLKDSCLNFKLLGRYKAWTDQR